MNVRNWLVRRRKVMVRERAYKKEIDKLKNTEKNHARYFPIFKSEI